MSTSRRRTLIVFVAVIAFAALAVWVVMKGFSLKKNPQQEAPSSIPTSSPSIISTPTSTAPTSPVQGVKTYRNEEWGLEFQYPEKWIIKREDESSTYYSKFFLQISAPVIVDNEEKFDPAFFVNIVLPEFIRGFDNLEKTTSEIIVAGVQGIKHEYIFNSFPETTVILPFGELRMILSTGTGSKQYLNEFNQILASFKFLK